MVKRGATFMSKRHCYTVSISFVQRTLKVLSKQLQSFAQLQCSPFPEVPRERGVEEKGKPLWVQVWDCWGAAGSCWDRCKVKDLHQKLGFALLLREERFATNACKLPGTGFRTDLNKDCTDSLSARNSKY